MDSKGNKSFTIAIPEKDTDQFVQCLSRMQVFIDSKRPVPVVLAEKLFTFLLQGENSEKETEPFYSKAERLSKKGYEHFSNNHTYKFEGKASKVLYVLVPDIINNKVELKPLKQKGYIYFTIKDLLYKCLIDYYKEYEEKKNKKTSRDDVIIFFFDSITKHSSIFYSKHYKKINRKEPAYCKLVIAAYLAHLVGYGFTKKNPGKLTNDDYYQGARRAEGKIIARNETK